MDYKNWETVIGLEIHAQLKTNTKLFSPDPAGWAEGENTQIHPVSLALPGTLPVLNREALKMAIKTGKAFRGGNQKRSLFERKNYFYPDLPKGYQISQYKNPFCQGGQVDFYFKGEKRRVSLERIHLEEDAGRTLYPGSYALINFNRAGVPLLEIVTRPVIKDPLEASACARAICRTLKYLDVCDGNLEEGSFRCDCNISLRPEGEKSFGTKVELKNLNSFRFIEKALFYEIDRQKAYLQKGVPVSQETRLYDSTKNQTRLMRSKEEVSDYRYFPDPDLPEVILDENFLREIEPPELPFEKASRFLKDYQLQFKAVEIITEDPLLAADFEQVVKETKDSEMTSHWFVGELQALLKEKGQRRCPVSNQNFSDLLLCILKGEISNKMAKEIFAEMWDTGLRAEEIIKKKNLKQISDSEKLTLWVDQVLKTYPSQVESYKKGRVKLFSFFVGQVMKLSKGQAHPQKLSQILKEKLCG